MGFSKYGEIENTYNDKLVEKARWNGLSETECICAVKIDGSNFQAGIDSDGRFFTGTRNQELKPEDDFCNWQKVMKKYDVERKLRIIKEKLNASEVVMYGELCGGLYRHPDVPRVEGAVRIQGRVDYSPDNEWVPFDLKVDGAYASQDLLKKLCDEVGLLSQQVVFRGTLEECLKFDPIFQDTTGNAFWGLPLIEGNIAEGVVIKPVNAVYIGESRVIFKNKTPKFKERIRKTKEASKAPGLNELEQTWIDKLLEYVNESRVYSALSKLGGKAEFSPLMKAVMDDALAEFRKENGAELDEVERSTDPKDFDWKKMGKVLSTEAVKVVRPVFLKECL